MEAATPFLQGAEQPPVAGYSRLDLLTAEAAKVDGCYHEIGVARVEQPELERGIVAGLKGHIRRDFELDQSTTIAQLFRSKISPSVQDSSGCRQAHEPLRHAAAAPSAASENFQPENRMRGKTRCRRLAVDAQPVMPAG
ncbi:MAG: hypothetical protein WA633_09640 [Stellaceae bacterium]